MSAGPVLRSSEHGLVLQVPLVFDAYRRRCDGLRRAPVWSVGMTWPYLPASSRAQMAIFVLIFSSNFFFYCTVALFLLSFPEPGAV